MRKSLLMFALLPQILSAAESPMNGAEFDAYTRGKTLTFSSLGQVYGTEQYLPGQRVLWAFAEDICREGIWYEEAGHICFVYDYDPVPQCWVFWKDNGLRARFVSGGSPTELREIAQSPDPLSCGGPEVGV